MSDTASDKGKHLLIEQRLYIERALDENYALQEIAERLEKDPTTISKEIRRNRTESGKKSLREPSKCKEIANCTKQHLCSKSCNHFCKKCKVMSCYRICPDYTLKKCSTLSRFPHVCNGCGRVPICHLQKYFYKAKVANECYETLRKTSREGYDLTPIELTHLDQLISPLVLKGQSIAHIYENHKAEISCSERTLYKYIDQNLFSARNIDLPRKVKYKPRRKVASPSSKTSSNRLGRTYEDFLAYLENHPELSIVEMDTVHGTRSGKVLLTFFFRNCSLMLAFLLDACTIECVNEVIDRLYEMLGHQSFQQAFPVILTDNGSEFKRPEHIEYAEGGKERTKVFYCNPMASYQKPFIEKNHEYIRYILPKGKSFNSLNQEDVTLMINHLNSATRASRNGSTPFQLAQLLLDKTLLEKLDLKAIPADEVHLKPALLKK